jgi:hypothetical protein
MSNNLKFEKCSDDEWSSLIENSHQSNLFSSIFFLRNSGNKYNLWKVTQGQEIKAGVCLNVDETEKISFENELVIHNGIFFNLDKKRILAKKREDEFQINSFIISNLVSRYDKIFLSLDPSINDIRPFQWYNYNTNSPKFEISIKYTSTLNLSELASQDNQNDENLNLYKDLETVRRYSIRQAKKEKYSVEFSNNAENFLSLYKKFINKISSSSAQDEFETVAKITNQILAQKKGIVSYVFDDTNQLIYSLVVGWDNKKAYYLYGVSSDKNKRPWQGTIGLWTIFKYIVKNTNVRIFDFEGVNSPNRGWFKLSFGGKLENYYQIKYDKSKIYTNK